MTIEVRQMLIKSQVAGVPPRVPAPALGTREMERLRQELLAECKAWLQQKLQEQRER
jgi:hypothetical protein